MPKSWLVNASAIENVEVYHSCCMLNMKSKQNIVVSTAIGRETILFRMIARALMSDCPIDVKEEDVIESDVSIAAAKKM